MDNEALRNTLQDVINWNVWDRLVEQTKQDIAKALISYKEPSKSRSITCYLYNSQGELEKQYMSITECADKLKTNESTVSNYTKKEWIFNGLLMSRELLRKDIAFAIYRDRLTHGKLYVSGQSSHKQIPIYSYTRDGNLVGVFESKYKWMKHSHHAAERIIYGDAIVDDRLVSENKYNITTAKEIYRKLREK